MNKQINEIKIYLENAYSGAKMMDDIEGMTRISRALVALQADVEKDIFTKEFILASTTDAPDSGIPG